MTVVMAQSPAETVAMVEMLPMVMAATAAMVVHPTAQAVWVELQGVVTEWMPKP